MGGKLSQVLKGGSNCQGHRLNNPSRRVPFLRAYLKSRVSRKCPDRDGFPSRPPRRRGVPPHTPLLFRHFPPRNEFAAHHREPLVCLVAIFDRMVRGVESLRAGIDVSLARVGLQRIERGEGEFILHLQRRENGMNITPAIKQVAVRILILILVRIKIKITSKIKAEVSSF